MMLSFSPGALQRIEEIRAYIAQDSPAAAARVAERFIIAALRLERYPLSGRNGRVAGTRELVITSLPYILTYRIQAEVVEIISVVHTSRKWPARF
jgi:addiction module RelE/StbE family toxin